nr:acyl-CoA carboxylase subunit epsilon [Streptomyces sp. Wb2n-11]
MVRGCPDDVELAAVIAVLSTVAGRPGAGSAVAPGPARAAWGGDGHRSRPAGSWRSGGRTRPGQPAPGRTAPDRPAS